FFFCYAVTHQRDLYSFPTRRSSDLGGVEGVMIHDQSGAGRSLLLYDLLMVAVVALAPSVAPLPARAAASPVHAAAAGTGGGTWTTYHHDNAHTGYDPLAPAAVPGAIAATPGWTQPTLDGEIYAEPLIFNGAV